MAVRKSRQVESRLIAEYIKETYPEYQTILNVPLGSIDESLMREVGYKKALGLMRPYRLFADALVILPRHLLLIEAKVWKITDGLAKLPIYKSLVPATPELQKYRNREVLMQLVVPWTNNNLKLMAGDLGVTVKIFSPEWIKDEVTRMHHYWTKEYRVLRDKKLAMRDYLGIE